MDTQSNSDQAIVCVNWSTNSQIDGSFYTINTIPASTTVVVASQLSGGGTVTCVGVYDENFAAPGYTTCR